MEMKVQSFERPDQLVAFINDESIPQAQIVTVREYAGRWYVFYYE